MFMSKLVQTRLVNGPFDDPCLYLDFCFGRRGILFDLGDIGPLSARELLRVSHVFVSHAHMDHVAGFDRLLRVCLHRSAPLHLVGPLRFIDQVACRLCSYTWNLLDESSADFRIDAHEFDGERLHRAATFRARDGFRRADIAPPEYPGGVVLEEENIVVTSASLDHGTPSLAFALKQGLKVNIWRSALEALGLPVGPWLNDAKRAVVRGESDEYVLTIPGVTHIRLGEVRDSALRISEGQRIAYITDAADTAENRDKIVALARGVDELFIETAFLWDDRALAARTHHLTARAAGELAAMAGVGSVTGFHYSGRYLPDGEPLDTELRQTFATHRTRTPAGCTPPPVPNLASPLEMTDDPGRTRT